MKKNKWYVHKFGGTSLANLNCFNQVSQIINKERQELNCKQAVVVSAMQGVTDALEKAILLAKKQDSSYFELVNRMSRQHVEIFADTNLKAGFKKIQASIQADCRDILDILRSIWLTQSYSDPTHDLILGYGEIWSAQILNFLLQKQKSSSLWLDAREVLVVEPHSFAPTVKWDISAKKLNQWVKKNKSHILIITGFVASTPTGIPTTLKRNGSDLSAAIFSNLLNAEGLTIWTDVDGIFSADPRRVKEAVIVDELSYTEAVELAFFGAKILHPKTMAPLIQKQIALKVKNTFKATLPGSTIRAKSIDTPLVVRGLSTIDNIAIINVAGNGMVGIHGIASRLFGALKEVKISAITISQASSEHSICFSIPQTQAKQAKAVLEDAFFYELHQGSIEAIEVVTDCSILAAVGDKMVEQPGIAAKFFSMLGRAGVNVRAIAQGSSERNITAIVDQKDSTKALRAAHAGFYLSGQVISVGIIGIGTVGGALLKQLDEQIESLKRDSKIDLRIRAVMSSKKMILKDDHLKSLLNMKDLLASQGQKADIETFTQHLKSDTLPHTLIIDCTASDDIANRYPKWLANRIHIVTPNKKANSGSMKRYNEIKKQMQSQSSQYLYEATVGAGLPIITTVKDLLRTGDNVLKIEGIFSGTLSYLFNQFENGKTFSKIVKEAKDKGYTEPDPREDLSGMDVARKVVILAREIGLNLNLKDLQIKSLVPKPLEHIKSIDSFMLKLSEHDHVLEALKTEATKQDKVLRYVGIVEANGQSRVELKAYAKSHPFSRLKGSDNMMVFHTTRYNEYPLLIQGPGAGPEVTAAGVFADVLRIVSQLEKPL